LKIEARPSGNPQAFESSLDLEIGEGCQQLADKIEILLNSDARKRRTLKDIPLTHVTAADSGRWMAVESRSFAPGTEASRSVALRFIPQKFAN
jgi:hypothetical protein